MTPTRRKLPDAPTLAAALAALREASEGMCNADFSVSVTEDVEPLLWLAAQPAGQRLYWADRSGQRTAGWGFAAVCDHLPASSDRYFGGMAFDPDAETAAAWQALGRCRFFLPALTLTADEQGLTLTLRARANTVDISAVTNIIVNPSDSLSGEITGHSPDFAGWSAGIGRAVAAFDRGDMRKVVLARQTTVGLHEPVDPFAMLARLQQPGGFVFGFEARAGHAFFGCSPERLFRRDDRALSTEALAGTRRRGNTRQQDLLLAAELKADAKERIEHHHVVEAIEADLAPLCAALAREQQPRIRRLARVQHLHTPFSGTLSSGVTDGDLLAAMHPTPAVCGRPTDVARLFIRGTEPFDRGWYAGPVGWIDSSGAEFAVAIRSALLVDGTLHFCTGAGIVAASRAASEWSELDAKSSGIVGLLQAAPAAAQS